MSKKVGVTGHQNIPAEAMPFLQSGISDVINDAGKEMVCISSLALGADQLFAEATLNAGGHLHAIIPCQDYEKTFLDESQIKHFYEILKQADDVYILDYRSPSEEAFLKAGYQVVDLSDILLAIWDGKKAKGKGGTADIVRYARKHNKEVIIMWPKGVVRT
jgi:predicted Rossmann fold nucleotide-binding protein DprA/Smf involved in DNA uptake